MADLGTLYFGIGLKDLITSEEIDKIRKRIEKEFSVSPKIDLTNIEKLASDAGRKFSESYGKAVSSSLSTSQISKTQNDTYKKGAEELERQSKLQLESQKSRIKAIQEEQAAQDRALKNRASGLARIETLLQRLNNLEAQVSAKQITASGAGYDEAIKKIQKYRAELEKLKSSSNLNLASTKKYDGAYFSGMSQEVKRLVSEQERLNRAMNTTKTVSSQIKNQTFDEIKIHEDVNQKLRSRVGWLQQIKNQFAGIVSLYAAERLLSNIIQIGGEFEKQKIALTSIVGDAYEAEYLFERIKTLAVKSPFQFSELASYTKQLAAFSIPTDELYDTTKRLADISAGLGVDMSRIILAYGQVRSAAFLKGTELRQFTEAGIPLVEELANKFSLLENRIVSAGEVMDKISRREVSFQMVKDVLFELTEEGGKFYNMQEELSKSLAGKFSNLKDAYQVMLSDIAKDQNSLLAGGLDVLTTLMQNWKSVAGVVFTLASAYGTAKVALIGYNTVTKVTVALNKTQVLLNAVRAMRGLTAATKAQIVAQSALNAVTRINPWVALASVLAAAAAALYVFSEKAKTAQEQYAEFMNNLEESENTIRENARNAREYVDAIFDEKKLQFERVDAFNKLVELYPEILKNQEKDISQLNSKAEALNLVNKAERDRLKNEYTTELDKVESQLSETQRQIKNIDILSKKIIFTQYGSVDYTKYKKQLSELREQETALLKEQDKLNSKLSAINDAELGIAKNIQEEWFKLATAKSEALGIPDYKPKDAEGYMAYMDKIKSAMEEAKKDLEKYDPSNKFSKETYDKLKNEYNALKTLYDLLGGANKSQEKGKDPIAEKYEKRVKLLKEAMSLYNKYLEQMGKEEALDKVNEDNRFKKLGFDPSTYTDALKEIYNALGNTEAQRKVKETISKYLSEYDVDILKQNAKNALDEVTKYIQEQTKKWNLYEKLFEITGNKEMSLKATFGADISDSSIIDDLRNKIKEVAGKKMEGDSVDVIIGLDENKIKERFGTAADSIIKLRDELVSKLNEKQEVNILDEAEVIAKYASIEEKAAAIRSKYEEKISTATTEEGRTAYAKEMQSELEKLYDESIKLLPLWQKLFGDATRMGYSGLKRTVEEAKKTINSIKEEKDAATSKSLFYFIDKEGKKRIMSLEEYLRLLEQVRDLQDELNSQNPFQGVIDGFKQLKNAETEDDKSIALKQIGESASQAAQMINQVADSWSSMFSALGNEGAADSISFAGEIFGELANTAEAFTSGNPIQMASAALTLIPNIISSIAKFHDKKLDRAIKKSQVEVQKLQNAYSNLERQIERQLGSVTESQSKEMIENLKSQQEELNYQLSKEQDKKDVDSSKVEDYKQQIVELQDQLKYFYEDLAEQQYDVNVKDWAEDLASSIVDAFAAGEDAAKAFDDTVAEIMKDVVKNMISLNVIQPAMESLRNFLFGDKGIFTDNSAGGTDITTTEGKELISQLLGLKDTIANAKDIWDVISEYAESVGVDMSDLSESTSGVSSGIESVTEDTANLLASYLNAIRQDVSVKREYFRQFIEEYAPYYRETLGLQLARLAAIEANTYISATGVTSILALLNAVANGTKSLKIK